MPELNSKNYTRLFNLFNALERLADYMAEKTGIRISGEALRQHLKSGGIVLSRPQHKRIFHDQQS